MPARRKLNKFQIAYARKIKELPSVVQLAKAWGVSYAVLYQAMKGHTYKELNHEDTAKHEDQPPLAARPIADVVPSAGAAEAMEEPHRAPERKAPVARRSRARSRDQRPFAADPLFRSALEDLRSQSKPPYVDRRTICSLEV
jgi:hypothetical protein